MGSRSLVWRGEGTASRFLGRRTRICRAHRTKDCRRASLGCFSCLGGKARGGMWAWYKKLGVGCAFARGTLCSAGVRYSRCVESSIYSCRYGFHKPENRSYVRGNWNRAVALRSRTFRSEHQSISRSWKTALRDMSAPRARLAQKYVSLPKAITHPHLKAPTIPQSHHPIPQNPTPTSPLTSSFRA